MMLYVLRMNTTFMVYSRLALFKLRTCTFPQIDSKFSSSRNSEYPIPKMFKIHPKYQVATVLCNTFFNRPGMR